MMGAIEEVAGVAPGTLLGAEIDTAQLDLLRDESGKLPANVFQLTRARTDKVGPGRRPGSRNKRSDQLARYVTEKYGDPVEGMASIYAMPLDQLVELLLVADGSKDREDRLLDLAERTEQFVERLYGDSEAGRALTDKQIEKLDGLVERVGDLAKVLKSKPGELALKALNTQLAARREVALYVHSKKPIAIDTNRRPDVILNIAGMTDPAALADMVGEPELSPEDWDRLEYADFSPVADAESIDEG